MFVIAMISLFYAPPSQADDVTLTWTNPTEQEQCTPAGATTIDGVHIWQLIATIPTLETHIISAMKPGSYTYAATAFNSDGESRLSGVAEKTVTGFSVIDERVYIVAKIPGRFLFLVVGTVPLGTACDVDVSVGVYNAVDPDEVTFTGAQDVVVVAQCG